MRPPSRKSGAARSTHKNFLGDSDASSDEEVFDSPEPDGTDYGLEFTTSRLSAPTTPRRCSTLREQSGTARRGRPPATASEEDSDDDEENQTPTESPARNTRGQTRTQERPSAKPRQLAGSTRRVRAPATEEDSDDDEENQTPPESPSRSTRGQVRTQGKPSANPRQVASSARSGRAPARATEDTEEESPTRGQSRRPLAAQSAATAQRQPLQQQQQRQPPARRKQKTPQHRLHKLQREMAYLQSTTKNLIPRLPFSRVVREVMMEFTSDRNPYQITRDALEALQNTAEMYLTQRFQDAYLLTMHRGRVTLEVRDMALVAFFCKSRGGI